MDASWSRQIPWLRGMKPHQFKDDGPPSEGKVYVLGAWASWSDKRKLRALRTMAREYGVDPRMRDYVIRNVIGLQTPAREYKRYAASILAFVQNNVAYHNEPGEIIQAPWYTLKVGYGDCDDMALLIATMAESIRLPWRFVLAGTVRGRTVRVAEGHRAPYGFVASHIYCDLGWPPFSEGKTKKLPDGRVVPATTWAAAEPTIKGLPLGHDVAVHGIPRGSMPELGRLGGMAVFGEGQTLPAVVEQAPGAISWWRSIPWRTVAIGTAQSVVASLLLRAILAAASAKRIVV